MTRAAYCFEKDEDKAHRGKDVMGKWRRTAGRFLVAGLVLVKVLVTTGCGGSTSSSNFTATPSLSPAGGTYTATQKVTISSATANAVLYCTTDGTTPTTSSPQCGQPTTVYKSEFLQAIAVAPGKSASSVASEGYTISLNATDTPTFSPAGGTYSSTQTVTISAATGANIYYTLDGTTPTALSSHYTAPITVSATETLSAVAIASGYDNSPVASATYTLDAIAAPTFSLPSGTYKTAQTVTITPGDSKSVTIYYAISANSSGTAPSSTSNAYTGAINVAQTETISAIAIDTNGKTSPVTTVAYAIGASQAVGAPTFSPASGSTITPDQPITITDTDSSAAIYYTTDGTPPTTASSVWSSSSAPSFSTPGKATIWAFALDSGVSSLLSSATYTVNAISAPTFSLASGALVIQGQTVTINTSDTYVPIYYTTDGSTPTASSAVYSSSSPISLSTVGDVTIRAKAITSDGSTYSSVATATYHVGSAGPTISGRVLGGTTAISGATVQLYAAGTTGYGSAGVVLGAAATTGSDGSFSISDYPCALAPNDQFYLVATGGDTGGGANSYIALMSAIGSCSSLTAGSTFTVNEVTTIASAYALSGFAEIDSGGGISVGAPATYNASISFSATATHGAVTSTASSCNASGKWQSTGPETCNYNGLANAFLAANNLVDPVAGAVRSYTPAYSQNLASDTNILNNSTVPTTRINALADMLATCVASESTCVGSLIADTTTTTITPKDTLQAALSIAQNPGNNVSTLLSLAASMTTPPYNTGTLLTQTTLPTDLTVALTYTGAGLGIAPGITLSDKNTGIIDGALGIDASGNIWVAAYLTQDGQNKKGEMLAEFNALGAPVTAATTLSSATKPVPTYGGYNPELSYVDNAGLTMLAIDQSGNLWTNDGWRGNVLEISTNPSLSVLNTVVDHDAAQVTIDASGDAWITNTFTNVNEFLPNGNAGVSNNNSVNASNALAFDSNGGLWAAGQNSNGQDVFQLGTSNGSITYDAFPSSTDSFTTTLAADGVGNVYGCDPTGANLDVFNAGAIANTYSITTQRACGSQLVLDGQGHIFAVLDNGSEYPITNFIANIDEFTAAGKLISPVANGYTGSSSAETPTLNVDASYNTPASVNGVGAAIDGSGNLWVLNPSTYGSNFSGTTAVPGNVLVEYVGIGAPVVTPTSLALANGILGARP